VAHESGSLRYVREIASGAAYEGRADLGNTQPGDGRRYKGRGLIQITGRANYAACSQALYGDDRLIRTPEILEQTEPACESAAWYWWSRGLNELADTGAFRAITKAVNGGFNGYDDRLAYYQRAAAVLA
jgi:putative chitinase